MLRSRKLRGRLGVESLLARLRQLGKVADFRHATRQLGARLRGFLYLRHVLGAFLRGNGLEPCLARVECKTERLPGGAVLDRLQSALARSRRQRDGQQAQDIKENAT